MELADIFVVGALCQRSCPGATLVLTYNFQIIRQQRGNQIGTQGSYCAGTATVWAGLMRSQPSSDAGLAEGVAAGQSHWMLEHLAANGAEQIAWNFTRG